MNKSLTLCYLRWPVHKACFSDGFMQCLKRRPFYPITWRLSRLRMCWFWFITTIFQFIAWANPVLLAADLQSRSILDQAIAFKTERANICARYRLSFPGERSRVGESRLELGKVEHRSAMKNGKLPSHEINKGFEMICLLTCKICQ